MTASRTATAPSLRPFLLFVIVIVLLTGPSWAARPDRGGDWASQMRAGPGASNHPVGVVPSRDIVIPKGWPTAPGGAITCLTCHEMLPGSSGRRSVKLRWAASARGDSIGFCANCHREAGPRTAAGMHWLALGVAHVPENRGRGSAAGGQLDAASRRCLGCHDGVSASEAVNSTHKSFRRNSFGDRGRNHPVGVVYPTGLSGRKAVRFRQPALLPAKVHLPAGRVSCVSCHDLYGGQKAKLTVPIEGSQLCMTCHDMG